VQLPRGFVTEPRADMTNISPAILLTQREGSAPKKGRVRLGAVNPAMTTSWRFEVLIFSQLSVRPPDTYLLSARLAMIPSRPFRSASSKHFVPLALR
jgi:hypothetical protein